MYINMIRVRGHRRGMGSLYKIGTRYCWYTYARYSHAASSLAVFTAALSAAAETVRLFISSVRSPNLVSSEVPIDHQYIYVYTYKYIMDVCVCVCIHDMLY
jgi:hypothetical protein